MREVSVFSIIILIGAGLGYLITRTKYGVTIGGVLAAFLGIMLYINELKKQS